MPSLQEARELLGMGNTQISIGTQSFPNNDWGDDACRFVASGAHATC